MAKSKTSVGSKGDIDLKNLQATLDAVTEMEKLTDPIRKEMVSIASLFAEQVNYAKTLTQEMRNQAVNMREVAKVSTNIKKLEEEILSINSRMGLETISNERMQKLINDQKTIGARLDLEAIKAAKELKTAREDLRGLAESASEKAKLEKNQATSEAKDLVETIKKNIKANQALGIVLNKQKDLIAAKNALEKTSVEDEKRKVEHAKKYADIYSMIAKIPIIGSRLKPLELLGAARQGPMAAYNEAKAQLKGLDPAAKLGLSLDIMSKVVGIFKKLAEVMFAMDTNITAVANGLAISKKFALDLTYSISKADSVSQELVGTFDQSFASISNVAKAITDLQEAFGTNTMYSKSMVESQILLTKQMGLTNDEAAGIQKLTYLTGLRTKEILDISLKQGKSNMSYKKVLLELSKVNSEISTSYNNQAGALTKAIKLAGEYGMTLDDTRKVADSLLSFESSIENELKAELLLGKQLNFEKARALALDGKSAEAAAEVVKQFGGVNGLARENVIVRRAAAESIGLSSEELTKFAQQQELLNKMGVDDKQILQDRLTALRLAGKHQEALNYEQEIARRTGSDILAQDIAKASLNARYEASVNRIKEIFASTLSGPLTGALNALANLLQHTTLLKVVFYSLIGILTTLSVLMAGIAISSALASGGGTWLAAGAVIAGIALPVAIGLASGPSSGYGAGMSPIPQMTEGTSAAGQAIPTPQGATSRINRGSTGVSGATAGGMSTGDGSSDVVSELRALRNDMKRGSSVNIDSVRSGVAYGMSRTGFA